MNVRFRCFQIVKNGVILGKLRHSQVDTKCVLGTFIFENSVAGFWWSIRSWIGQIREPELSTCIPRRKTFHSLISCLSPRPPFRLQWFFVDLWHGRMETGQDNPRSVPVALKRIDIPGVMFFVGMLFAIQLPKFMFLIIISVFPFLNFYRRLSIIAGIKVFRHCTIGRP